MAEPYTKFEAGDVIQRGKTMRLVVTADVDGKGGLVFLLSEPKWPPVPEARLRRMSADELEGWALAELGGPRLVEARRVGEDKIAWSAYLPDMSAAFRFWQEIHGSEPRLYDVFIRAADLNEEIGLDEMGYLGPEVT